MPEERWLPIPGFDGYEVSSLGRVMSYRRGNGRVLRPGPTGNGYLGYCLHDADGKRCMRKAHVLVAAAFIGPRPPGQDIRHLDGDQLNNSAENLAYGSRSQNMHDQVAHGTHAMARKTHCPAGHPYSPENTYLAPPSGKRACRACARERYQRRMFAAANIQTTEVAA